MLTKIDPQQVIHPFSMGSIQAHGRATGMLPKRYVVCLPQMGIKQNYLNTSYITGTQMLVLGGCFGREGGVPDLIKLRGMPALSIWAGAGERGCTWDAP